MLIGNTEQLLLTASASDSAICGGTLYVSRIPRFAARIAGDGARAMVSD